MLRKDFNQKYKDYYSKVAFDGSLPLMQIQQETKYISPFISWGISEVENLDGRGILFNVWGCEHKGKVLITKGWDNCYEVRFFSSVYVIVKPTCFAVLGQDLYTTINMVVDTIPVKK